MVHKWFAKPFPQQLLPATRIGYCTNIVRVRAATTSEDQRCWTICSWREDYSFQLSAQSKVILWGMGDSVLRLKRKVVVGVDARPYIVKIFYDFKVMTIASDVGANIELCWLIVKYFFWPFFIIRPIRFATLPKLGKAVLGNYYNQRTLRTLVKIQVFTGCSKRGIQILVWLWINLDSKSQP